MSQRLSDFIISVFANYSRVNGTTIDHRCAILNLISSISKSNYFGYFLPSITPILFDLGNSTYLPIFKAASQLHPLVIELIYSTNSSICLDCFLQTIKFLIQRVFTNFFSSDFYTRSLTTGLKLLLDVYSFDDIVTSAANFLKFPDEIEFFRCFISFLMDCDWMSTYETLLQQYLICIANQEFIPPGPNHQYIPSKGKNFNKSYHKSFIFWNIDELRFNFLYPEHSTEDFIDRERLWH